MPRRATRQRRDRPGTSDSPVTVVGRRPALEALRSGRAIEVLVAEGARSTSALREVVEAADAAGVSLRSAPAERIEALAEGARHQGVAARVRPVAGLTEAALSAKQWGEEATVVVIDGVTDPQNLGALARTAEAAGAEALVCRRHRAARIGNVAVKASAGALIHLPVAEVPNLPRVLRMFKDHGFWVVGLDAGATITINEEPPPGRIALVLGAEGEGLSRLVRETCDALVAIPLRGHVGSLNVSVAAGVALFAYTMRGRAGKKAKQEP